MIVPESVSEAYDREYAAHLDQHMALAAALDQFKAELLDHAWDGRARGAILGAIKALEEAQEPPGYAPKH